MLNYLYRTLMTITIKIWYNEQKITEAQYGYAMRQNPYRNAHRYALGQNFTWRKFMNHSFSEGAETAQAYYDSMDTDRMYRLMWGGEHIHFGIYMEPDEPIHVASLRTVETMAQTLREIGPESRIIDLGAGYGGAARYLAKEYGCSVSCLNISTAQNERNRQLNREQGLDSLIDVQEGSFEAIPFPDDSFDIVWSQDAILHSSNRYQVFEEIRRVLKAGGELIFTDPMQSETCPSGLLQPAFDRLGIKDMGSAKFYRDTAQTLGFEEAQFINLSQHVPTHYRRLGEEVKRRYKEVVQATSADFVDRTLTSIEPWHDYYEQGYMQWGIWHFCQPKE